MSRLPYSLPSSPSSSPRDKCHFLVAIFVILRESSVAPTPSVWWRLRALFFSSICFHSRLFCCLILTPTIAKLVWLKEGLMRVALLASWSAISLPSIFVCPGTQCRVMSAPLDLMDLAAFIALIWHSCPGLSDGDSSLHSPAWLSE